MPGFSASRGRRPLGGALGAVGFLVAAPYGFNAALDFAWFAAQAPRALSAARARSSARPGLLVARRTAAAELPDEFSMAPNTRKKGPFAFLRCLAFGIFVFSTAAFFVNVMLVALPWTRRRDPIRRRFMDRINFMWAKIAVWPFFKVEVINPENLPGEDRAYVYVGNHQSYLDIFSMYCLGRPFKWVSKASIFKFPIIGWAMALTGHVALERNDRKSQLSVVRDCVFKLTRGASMFFFPEGTRSKDGVLGEFKKGAVSIARRAKVGLAPVTVLGTGAMMPSGMEYMLFWSRPGVRLVCHPVISAEEVQQMGDMEILERLRSSIASAMPPALRGPGDEAAAVA